MAVVNASPDSFSGDGMYAPQQAGSPLEQRVHSACRAAAADGADLLDIGAVAAFPGAPRIAPEEELDRLRPVLLAARQSVSVPISIDTYSAPVAAWSLANGADVINSVWGLRHRDGNFNTELADVVADAGVPFILSHNAVSEARLGPNGPTNVASRFGDVNAEVYDDMARQIEVALSRGIQESQLIVDTGLGMGKTPKESLQLLRTYEQLLEFGYPTLLSHSRKNFIGEVVGGIPKERDAASVAAASIGIMKGVDMLRVHNVKAHRQAAMLLDAIYR